MTHETYIGELGSYTQHLVSSIHLAPDVCLSYQHTLDDDDYRGTVELLCVGELCEWFNMPKPFPPKIIVHLSSNPLKESVKVRQQLGVFHTTVEVYDDRDRVWRRVGTHIFASGSLRAHLSKTGKQYAYVAIDAVWE